MIAHRLDTIRGGVNSSSLELPRGHREMRARGAFTTGLERFVLLVLARHKLHPAMLLESGEMIPEAPGSLGRQAPFSTPKTMSCVDAHLSGPSRRFCSHYRFRSLEHQSPHVDETECPHCLFPPQSIRVLPRQSNGLAPPSSRRIRHSHQRQYSQNLDPPL